MDRQRLRRLSQTHPDWIAGARFRDHVGEHQTNKHAEQRYEQRRKLQFDAAFQGSARLARIHTLVSPAHNGRRYLFIAPNGATLFSTSWPMSARPR
jgi:hypothetical protein